MSKLACHCGAVVSDVAFPSPTEGEIRTQEDLDAYEGKIVDAIAAFHAAVADGSRSEWIERFFKPGYPLDVSDSGVAWDIRAVFEQAFLLRVCECEACGRLYVQKAPGENDYACFELRSGRYEAVLKKKGASPGTGKPQS